MYMSIIVEKKKLAQKFKLWFKICRDCKVKNNPKATKCRKCKNKNLRWKKRELGMKK